MVEAVTATSSKVGQSLDSDRRPYAVLTFTTDDKSSACLSWSTQLHLTMPWRKKGSSEALTVLGSETQVVIQAFLRPQFPAHWTVFSVARNPPPMAWAVIEEEDLLDNVASAGLGWQSAASTNPVINVGPDDPFIGCVSLSGTTPATVIPSQPVPGIDTPAKTRESLYDPLSLAMTGSELLEPPTGNILWTICPSPDHSIPPLELAFDQGQRISSNPSRPYTALQLYDQSLTLGAADPEASLPNWDSNEPRTTVGTFEDSRLATAVQMGESNKQSGHYANSNYGSVGGEAETIHVALNAGTKTIRDDFTSVKEDSTRFT